MKPYFQEPEDSYWPPTEALERILDCRRAAHEQAREDLRALGIANVDDRWERVSAYIRSLQPSIADWIDQERHERGKRRFHRRRGERADGCYRTPDGTVCVKTGYDPKFLFVEDSIVGRRADIVSLMRIVVPAHIVVPGEYAFLGWASREDIQTAPLADVGGFGVLSHYLPVESLRSLDSLPSNMRNSGEMHQA